MDSTTESLNRVKARIKATIEEALYLAEVPATVFLPVLTSGNREASIPVNVPRSFSSLAMAAYAVETACCNDDVTLMVVRVATCECYECMLRANVAALLSVAANEQEGAA